MSETKTANRSNGKSIELIGDLLAHAKKLGATASDAIILDGVSLSVSQRMGKREDLERSEGREIGIRIFYGKRQAIVSTTETSKKALDDLLNRAIDMAKAASEDPYCGLVENNSLASSIPNLDLLDSNEPSSESLYSATAETEDAALAVKGVTNSNSAGASWSRSEKTIATSGGFIGSYSSSSNSIVASVIAGKGSSMETDYAYSRARHRKDLSVATKIGSEAGERSVLRLNPTKVKSGPAPVVFEQRVANSMLRHLAQSISGSSIARKTSFLRNQKEKLVFNQEITIIDDPHRSRGLISRPFDDEGAKTKKMILVKDGILQSWILSSDSARQLGMTTTGHAQRSISTPPAASPSNLYIKSGSLTPNELISDIKEGVWITELIGFGVNLVTGDYSRGAAGFLIRNGKVSDPISEFTIAGNLKEMFRNMTVANDLIFQFGSDSPTLRIDGMFIAGK